MIILITGTPGCGKSETAKVLSGMINAEIIDLKHLALKEKAACGYDSESGTIVIDEKKIDSIVKKNIKKGKKYIIDSHLSQFVSPKRTKLIVVLRTNPKILEKRLKKRLYSSQKLYDNAMCECLDYCLIESIKLGHKNHLHEIDTTKKSPKKVAKEIVDVLNNKKEKEFGKIVWV